MSDYPITNISVLYNVALITVDNLPVDMKLISDIFNAIASQNINIDMITQTPHYRGSINISFSLPSDDLVKAISALNMYKKLVPNLHIQVDADNTKLSVFGDKMKDLPGVAAKLFTLFSDNGIEIKLVTTSEIDISYLIYEKDVDRATEAIRQEYKIV